MPINFTIMAYRYDVIPHWPGAKIEKPTPENVIAQSVEWPNKLIKKEKKKWNEIERSANVQECNVLIGCNRMYFELCSMSVHKLDGRLHVEVVELLVMHPIMLISSATFSPLPNRSHLILLLYTACYNPQRASSWSIKEQTPEIRLLLVLLQLRVRGDAKLHAIVPNDRKVNENL